MDLYTASRRISTAFRVDGAPLASDHYGVIGDGYTVALELVDPGGDFLRFSVKSNTASLNTMSNRI